MSQILEVAFLPSSSLRPHLNVCGCSVVS